MTELTPTQPERILVVDDDPRNRKLLIRMLEVDHYHTEAAESGEQALEMIKNDPPDLVLLDVMMPGLDGYEVCRRIKANPETTALPVIFVTALHESSEQVRGLDAGGTDFVTKPVDHGVLLARLRTHLRIKRLGDEMVEKNRKLLALETLRDDLVHMLVHDLKNPLCALEVSIELLRLRGVATNPDNASVLDNVTDCTDRIGNIVHNVLDVARLENAQLKLDARPMDVDASLRKTLAHLFPLLEKEELTLEIETAADLPHLVADSELVARVVENLVSNAIKVSDEGGDLVVAAELTGSAFVFSVADRGRGVPSELREAIFEKFRTGPDDNGFQTHNHGLGLTFCKMAVGAHGGKIWVEDREGGGSLFKFQLPAAPSCELTTPEPVAVAAP